MQGEEPCACQYATKGKRVHAGKTCWMGVSTTSSLPFVVLNGEAATGRFSGTPLLQRCVRKFQEYGWLKVPVALRRTICWTACSRYRQVFSTCRPTTYLGHYLFFEYWRDVTLFETLRTYIVVQDVQNISGQIEPDSDLISWLLQRDLLLQDEATVSL